MSEVTRRIPGRIINVELTGALEAIDRVENGIEAEQLMIVGSVAEVPFAVRIVGPDEGPLSPSMVRQLFDLSDEEVSRRAEASRDQRAALEEAVPLSVSVVVCTRNRSADLTRCLASLQELSYPGTEIVIVDNSPSDDATWEIAQASSGPHAVVYVREDVPGLSNARNTGIGVAGGEIVAWVDDDEIVDPNWVTGLVATYVEHPDAAAVYGLRLPAELKTEAQWRFESSFVGIYSRELEPRQVSSKSVHPLQPSLGWASMSFRRVVLSHYGFDAALGAGTLTAGGEDLKITAQLLADGRTLYTTTSAVSHHFHREDDEAFARQMFGYGSGLTAYVAAILLWRPSLALAIPRLLVQMLRKRRGALPVAGHSDEGEQLSPELAATHTRGLIAGPWLYFRARLQAGRTPSEARLRPRR